MHFELCYLKILFIILNLLFRFIDEVEICIMRRLHIIFKVVKKRNIECLQRFS